MNEGLKFLLLLLMLLMFSALLVNLLFAVVFGKRIRRDVTVVMGVASGLIGYFLPSLFGFLLGSWANDPLYWFLSSIISCVVASVSTSFLQVILKLRKDEAN
jgi:hypothetical protein